MAFALGLASMLYLVTTPGMQILTIPQKMVSGIDSFPLLAIPFFLLAGELMNRGGITKRLVTLASALVGQLSGGLAHVNIVANVIMAGMSGSSVADASAIGTVVIPTMVQGGYSPRFAAAITASASTIGPVIPPSIPFVIYGSLAGVSIGALFLSGVVPGLLMGGFLMIAAYIIAKRRHYGASDQFAWRTLAAAVVDGILPLMAPVIILGGILTGIFTATESAAVAIFYALAVGLFYRQLNGRQLFRAVEDVVAITGTVAIIVSTSTASGWILAIEQIPTNAVDWMRSITTNPLIVLLMLNVVLLILGCLMDPTPIMVTTIPVLGPLAAAFGIDPVQMGLIVVLNLQIGQITPPVGMSMYIACMIANIKVTEFTREIVPFFIALVVVLVIATYLPDVVLWLPRTALGAP